MRRWRLLAVIVLMMAAGEANGQTPADPAAAPPPLFEVGASEWMVTGGPAFGVELFHSSPGHRYILSTLSWGRILTRPQGPGVLRGRFEWALELVPLLGQQAPDRNYGVGVTPLTWRWNFMPRGRLLPFAELAAGLLWTRDPLPAGTTAANFTAHAAYGLRYYFRPRTALVAAYRLHHISNGNRLDRNPGVNAHVLQVGLSLLQPAR